MQDLLFGYILLGLIIAVDEEFQPTSFVLANVQQHIEKGSLYDEA